MNPDYSAVHQYVDAQRTKGVPDDKIHQSLLTSGWTEEIAQQIMTVTPQTSVPAAVPPSVIGASPAEEHGLYKGRIGRLGYLAAAVYVALYFIIAIGIGFIGRGSRVMNIVAILMGVVGVVAILLLSISLNVRRWHDIGQSGWLTLLSLIPAVGGIVFIVLLLIPGNDGPNQYGPRPAKSFSPKVIFGFSK